MGYGVIFSSRQKPVDQIHAIVFYALFAGTEVAFLAFGVVGRRPVFGEEQAFVQGSRSHHQRPGELAESNDSKKSSLPIWDSGRVRVIFLLLSTIHRY